MKVMLFMQIKTVIGMLSLPFMTGVLSAGWLFAGEQAKPGDASKGNIIHVDAAEAAKLVADNKVVVLDLRTPKEYATGHIAGAVNIDFYAADFERRLAQLDRHKTYLVHCAVGGRSTKSLALFQKLEFQSIRHLDGGLKAWQKAGHAVQP